MSIPNLTNSIIQPQSIVINQVPLSHAIMTNVNATNGIPIATALTHTPSTIDQAGEIKTGIVVETIPIVGVPSIPVQGANAVKTVQPSPNAQEGLTVCIY